MRDITNKILRHVSPAFCEDPLRVLRVCRFQAKFPNFTIAPNTFKIMHHMIHDPDFKTLSHHRLWQELLKTLDYPAPFLFFKTLFDLNWLPKRIFESFSPIYFNKDTHPLCKFALLISNQETLNWLNQMFQLPNDYQFIVTQTLKHQRLITGEYQAHSVLNMLQDLKAFSDPKWLPIVGEIAKYKGNKNIESILFSALKQAKTISAKNFPDTPPGPSLGEKIKTARIEAIAQIL